MDLSQNDDLLTLFKIANFMEYGTLYRDTHTHKKEAIACLTQILPYAAKTGYGEMSWVLESGKNKKSTYCMIERKYGPIDNKTGKPRRFVKYNGLIDELELFVKELEYIYREFKYTKREDKDTGEVKEISYHELVKLLASMTDTKYLGECMYPISEYLEKSGKDKYEIAAWVTTAVFFFAR